MHPLDHCNIHYSNILTKTVSNQHCYWSPNKVFAGYKISEQVLKCETSFWNVKLHIEMWIYGVITINKLTYISWEDVAFNK